MFRQRRIESDSGWSDADGIKIYTVSASGAAVEHNDYLPRLAELKATKPVEWSQTPAFAIFHDGSGAQYLVLAWWGNDNEMLVSVSVRQDDGWVEDPGRYSFCLWDLEIMWAERNLFIEHLYCAEPSLHDYRNARLRSRQTAGDK